METLKAVINWDTDGMPLRECGLPKRITILNAPPNWRDLDVRSSIQERIENKYGFLAKDFALSPVKEQTQQLITRGMLK